MRPMRRLVLLLLFRACTDSEPARCGDGDLDELEDCDDGNGVGGDGCTALCGREPAITVFWEFFPHVGEPEMLGACRPGVATIEMINTLGKVDTVPCDDRRSTEIFVPWGEQLLVRLRASDGSSVAESLPGRIFAQQFRAQFFEDGGYVRASYQLADTCTTQTPMVELTLTGADGTVTTDTQTCSAPGTRTGVVISAPHRAGLYDVRLVTTAGTATATGVRIDDNNTVTDLVFGPDQ